MALWRLTLNQKSARLDKRKFFEVVDCSEMIVAARSEDEARQLAFEESSEKWWLSRTVSICVEIPSPSKPGIIAANWPPL
jgi:hypothetical protein